MHVGARPTTGCSGCATRLIERAGARCQTAATEFLQEVLWPDDFSFASFPFLMTVQGGQITKFEQVWVPEVLLQFTSFRFEFVAARLQSRAVTSFSPR